MSKVLQGIARKNPSLLDSDFERISSLAHKEAGLSFTRSKIKMIETRLAPRIRARGLCSYSAYCDVVSSDSEAEERRLMVSALTTNVTSFFREPYHFEMLREQILPDLMQRLRSGERVRIWSAGCSKGPEPYSIAITLLSAEPRIAEYDIRILATDIDPAILETAHRGEYSIEELSGVTPDIRKKFFKLTDKNGRYQAIRPLRDLIRFRELNLLSSWPMSGRFNIIFCRNVVIYFDDDTQEKLWPRFEAANTTDGWLFLGHSERLSHASHTRYRNAGMTAYTLGNPGT